MLQVLLGFMPWVLCWVLSGFGHWTAAGLAGLIAVSGLVIWRWFRRRNFKTMEIVTLAFFAAHGVLSAVLHLTFLRTYDVLLVSPTLAIMAWGGLLAGSPFTYEYARESYPARLVEQPAVPPDKRDSSPWFGAEFSCSTRPWAGSA